LPEDFVKLLTEKTRELTGSDEVIQASVLDLSPREDGLTPKGQIIEWVKDTINSVELWDWNANVFKKISEMGLSIRSLNALQRAGIEFVYQLVVLSEDVLLKTPNLNETCLDEIKEVLFDRGLELRMKLNFRDKETGEVHDLPGVVGEELPPLALDLKTAYQIKFMLESAGIDLENPQWSRRDQEVELVTRDEIDGIIAQTRAVADSMNVSGWHVDYFESVTVLKNIRRQIPRLLIEGGIEYLYQLIQCSEEDLKEIDGVGSAYIHDIKMALQRQYGLSRNLDENSLEYIDPVTGLSVAIRPKDTDFIDSAAGKRMHAALQAKSDLDKMEELADLMASGLLQTPVDDVFISSKLLRILYNEDIRYLWELVTLDSFPWKFRRYKKEIDTILQMLGVPARIDLPDGFRTLLIEKTKPVQVLGEAKEVTITYPTMVQDSRAPNARFVEWIDNTIRTVEFVDGNEILFREVSYLSFGRRIKIVDDLRDNGISRIYELVALSEFDLIRIVGESEAQIVKEALVKNGLELNQKIRLKIVETGEIIEWPNKKGDQFPSHLRILAWAYRARFHFEEKTRLGEMVTLSESQREVKRISQSEIDQVKAQTEEASKAMDLTGWHEGHFNTIASIVAQENDPVFSRIFNKLIRAGIEYVYQLVQYTEDELINIYKINQISVDFIKEFLLRKYGLKLGVNVTYVDPETSDRIEVSRTDVTFAQSTIGKRMKAVAVAQGDLLRFESVEDFIGNENLLMPTEDFCFSKTVINELAKLNIRYLWQVMSMDREVLFKILSKANAYDIDYPFLVMQKVLLGIILMGVRFPTSFIKLLESKSNHDDFDIPRIDALQRFTQDEISIRGAVVEWVEETTQMVDLTGWDPLVFKTIYEIPFNQPTRKRLEKLGIRSVYQLVGLSRDYLRKDKKVAKEYVDHMESVLKGLGLGLSTELEYQHPKTGEVFSLPKDQSAEVPQFLQKVCEAYRLKFMIEGFTHNIDDDPPHQVVSPDDLDIIDGIFRDTSHRAGSLLITNWQEAHFYPIANIEGIPPKVIETLREHGIEYIYQWISYDALELQRKTGIERGDINRISSMLGYLFDVYLGTTRGVYVNPETGEWQYVDREDPGFVDSEIGQEIKAVVQARPQLAKMKGTVDLMKSGLLLKSVDEVFFSDGLLEFLIDKEGIFYLWQLVTIKDIRDRFSDNEHIDEFYAEIEATLGVLGVPVSVDLPDAFREMLPG
jgi:DNA-directed RNA polymerase alpha subunit